MKTWYAKIYKHIYRIISFTLDKGAVKQENRGDMKRLRCLLSIPPFLLLISLPAIASEEKISQDTQPIEQMQKGAVLQMSPFIAPYADNQTASSAVERSMSLFANRIKDRFALYLSRSGKYIDIMQYILRKKDVPEDIVFLSLIESGFNTNAYSIAHASPLPLSFTSAS